MNEITLYLMHFDDLVATRETDDDGVEEIAKELQHMALADGGGDGWEIWQSLTDEDEEVRWMKFSPDGVLPRSTFVMSHNGETLASRTITVEADVPEVVEEFRAIAMDKGLLISDVTFSCEQLRSDGSIVAVEVEE